MADQNRRAGALAVIVLITGLLCGCASTEKVMIVKLPKGWLVGEYFDTCFADIGSAAAILDCITTAVPRNGIGSVASEDAHTFEVKFIDPDTSSDPIDAIFSFNQITDAQIQKNTWRCQILQNQDSKEYSMSCNALKKDAH